MTKVMRAVVRSVDYAPDDLYAQVPFGATLLRALPGPNRDDYWLGRLDRPLRYAKGGSDREITHIILASRYVGESIHPTVGRVVVGITYVLDEAQVGLPAVDMTRCLYAAIGEAEISVAAG
jgi:hypothetical protein